jgi:hypothetical protein
MKIFTLTWLIMSTRQMNVTISAFIIRLWKILRKHKFIDSKHVVTSCDSNIHLFPVEKDDDTIVNSIDKPLRDEWNTCLLFRS